MQEGMGGVCVKGARNNLFYKMILTSPKGLSTGLPDMVLHRYVFRIVTAFMTGLYLYKEGLKYKVKTLLRRSEDRLVKNSPEGVLETAVSNNSQKGF